MGVTVYDIDSKISNVSDIRAALVASRCKMIIFPPKTESQDNLRLLRYAVPELFYCKLKHHIYGMIRLYHRATRTREEK